MNIPLFLTFIRLIISPLFPAIALVYYSSLNNFFINSVLATAFIALTLTDFFDGYLARLYKQETLLGRVLDPIADKILVTSTLTALVAAHKVYFVWAIIIIARDFFVSGLREIALTRGFSVPVTYVGKIKTMFQCLSITWVILNPAQERGWDSCAWNCIEALLWTVTLFLTVYSGFLYYREFKKH